MSSNSPAEKEQPFSKLNPQEKHALLLLSQGRSNREIGRGLFLGEGTVRNYVNSILSKLGVASPAEAVAYASKHDLRGHIGLE